MADLTIHPAETKDAERILNMMLIAFEEHRVKLNPPSGVFLETVESITKKIADGGGFIATKENIMVGSVLFQPYPDHMYLGRLAVHPEYRQQGIAHRLVQEVEQLANRLHLPQIRLGVRIILEGNRQFFESLGFQVVSYESHAGHSEPTFMWMAKQLTPQSAPGETA